MMIHTQTSQQKWYLLSSVSLVGLLIILFLTCPVSASSTLDNPEETPFVGEGDTHIFVMQNYTYPINASDMVRYRGHILETMTANKLLVKTPLIYSEPKLRGDDKIITYGYFIDKNGVVYEHEGIAATESSSGSVFNSSRKWYAEITEKIINTTPDSSSEKDPDGQEWVQVYQSSIPRWEKPYGGVEVAYSVESLTNSDVPWYTVKQWVTMTAGKKEYPDWLNFWDNDNGKMTHDWASGAHTDTLGSYGPTTTNTGKMKVSYSLSGSGPSISLSFDQLDIESKTLSGASEKKPAWQMTARSDDTWGEKMNMLPASQAKMKSTTDTKYLLMNLHADGQFMQLHGATAYHHIKNDIAVYSTQ